MSIKFKKKVALFFRYLATYGVFKGLFLFITLRTGKSPFRVPGLKFPVHIRKGTSDLSTFDQIFVSRNYNFKLSFSPAVIIDCGANIGMATLYFAARFPNAKIISVEPEEQNFQVLQKNTAHLPQVSLLKNALWSKPGKLVIEDVGKGSYAYTVRDSSEVVLGKVIGEIECTTLDQIIRDFSLSSVDILKIDIEGAEREIFRDPHVNWLNQTRSIVIELHDWIEPGASEIFVKAVSTQHNFVLGGYKEGMIFTRYENQQKAQ